MLHRYEGSFLLITWHFSSECHRWSAVAERGSSAETTLPGLEQKPSWRDTELERTSVKPGNCEGSEQEIESYRQIYIRGWQEVVQPAAQSLHLTPHHGGHSHSHSRKKEEYVWEWFWACCNCAVNAGLSTTISVGCPGCQHIRCAYCPMESAQILVSR
jgi:hypothetical protein